MVFAFLRDVYNYYFGNRFPSRELVATLTERSDEGSGRSSIPRAQRSSPASTMLVKYSFKPMVTPSIIRQPSILRPIEDDEYEAWVETHPSQSVCIKRLQIHEEF